MGDVARSHETVAYPEDKDLVSDDELRAIAREARPKMVLCGYSSYPRDLDYAAFKSIADEVGALTMADVRKLPRVEMITEFKCIEGWSEIVYWGGVRLRDFLEAFPPQIEKASQFHPSAFVNSLPEYIAFETPDGQYYRLVPVRAPGPGPTPEMVTIAPSQATANVAPVSNCRLINFEDNEYQPEYTTVCGPQ